VSREKIDVSTLQNLGPAPGTVWVHYKGGDEYAVLETFLLEKDLTPMVAYRCLKTGHKWGRPVSEWAEVMPNGLPRFRPYRPPDGEEKL
jgi:hypothetical protein